MPAKLIENVRKNGNGISNDERDEISKMFADMEGKDPLTQQQMAYKIASKIKASVEGNSEGRFATSAVGKDELPNVVIKNGEVSIVTKGSDIDRALAQLSDNRTDNNGQALKTLGQIANFDVDPQLASIAIPQELTAKIKMSLKNTENGISPEQKKQMSNLLFTALKENKEAIKGSLVSPAIADEITASIKEKASAAR